MAEHNNLGRLGEEMAVDYLCSNNYEILETNWVFQKAEIDIIAQKGNILAAIEVKTRSSKEFGLAEEFVNPKKIQLLVKAANEYITRNSLDVEARFDIISVYKQQDQFEIMHFEDAFYHF